MLVELAVVFLLMGALLIFVISSFNGCVKALTKTKDVQRAQILAERTLAGEMVKVPSQWQILEEERMVQGVRLKEVQVLDVQSGKIIFNLLWLQ